MEPFEGLACGIQGKGGEDKDAEGWVLVEEEEQGKKIGID